MQPDQAIYIIPDTQTPSLGGASSNRHVVRQISTLNSDQLESNMLSERAGIMFYDDLENGSQHQNMKVLGKELQEQMETSPSEAQGPPLESQASSKYVNPLKSTETHLDEGEWDGFFDKPQKGNAPD